jgi:iron complex transport system substrate-binding protein
VATQASFHSARARPSSTPRGWASCLRALPLAALILGTASACGRAESTPARLILLDDAGDTLRLPAPARRIVSLNPSTTEILFAIGAGGWVVGRTASCDYPPAVAEVPNVGGGFPPNVEAVVAHHPDLVVLYHGAGNASAAARFRQLGVAVLRLRTNHLSDVPRATRLLGALTGREPAADSVAGVFESALDRERAVARGRLASTTPVLILAWDQPIIALGSGSFVSELVELAGGRNVFADVDDDWAEVSWEDVVAREPDIVLILDYGDETIGQKRDFLRTHPITSTLRAVQEGGIVVVGLTDVVPGIRNGDVVATMAAGFHPDRTAG